MTAVGYLKKYILDNGITHITPGEVVKMAKDPNSPMHGFFCWDNKKAAHLYRLRQARNLIANIKITVASNPPVRVRLMVSVPSERGKEGYQLLSHAINNPDARAELKKEMERWIEHWQSKASLLDADTIDWLKQYPVSYAQVA